MLVRLGLIVVLLAAVTATGACGGSGSEASRSHKKPSPTEKADNQLAASARLGRVVPSAAAAGPPCEKFDYAVIQQVVGMRFDVAAAIGPPGSNQTCVLRTTTEPLPYLTLVRVPRKMTPDAFRSDFLPDKATAVDGLGKAAYQKAHPAKDNKAGTEVGWLTENEIYLLTLTTATEADRSVADKIVELARRIS